MEAFVRGWPGARLAFDSPPNDGEPFVTYGQIWGAQRIVPAALANKRPFFWMDNGWYMPARGEMRGYYRLTYRSLAPILLNDISSPRIDLDEVPMRPWREDGRHVLIAMPGKHFGEAIGLDMPAWVESIGRTIKNHTDRPIKIRPKRTDVNSLLRDLKGCWALVTHSSNVAIDAVRRGIPVFVAPTSPAAPVGNLDLASMENPVMPPRKPWWRSLMRQQFTLDEISSGVAYRFMTNVVQQVDG
jgi:hypothetical protein